AGAARKARRATNNPSRSADIGGLREVGGDGWAGRPIVARPAWDIMTVRNRKDQSRREAAMRTAAFVFLFLSLNAGAAGVIDTGAGSGKPGYAGDGGAATGALLNQPFHCDLGKGALYVADAFNHCVRKVDLKSGTITTVAGCGEKGYAGDGGPATKA